VWFLFVCCSFARSFARSLARSLASSVSRRTLWALVCLSVSLCRLVSSFVCRLGGPCLEASLGIACWLLGLGVDGQVVWLAGPP
jgi:hypothetical protein